MKLLRAVNRWAKGSPTTLDYYIAAGMVGVALLVLILVGGD